jgi:hypothetical protein
MEKLSDKLSFVLENAQKPEEQVEEQFDEAVWRTIRELSENDWYRGRKSRTLAAKKIHQIAESKDKQARKFMKALNKAASTIALHLERKKK